MTRVFACVALFGVVAAASCRAVSVCEDAERCAAPVANAASGGQGPGGDTSSGGTSRGGTSRGGSSFGGASHAGGTPSAPSFGGATRAAAGGPDAGGAPAAGAAGASCRHPLENCDKSWLNGCETDLWWDPLRCGYCDAICEGICTRRGCLTPDMVTEQNFWPQTPFAITADHLYFLSATLDEPYRVIRAHKLGFAVETLIETSVPISGLAVADGRVYVWGEGNLRSVKGRGDLIDEGFTADWVVGSADVAYAVRNGALVARKPGDTAWSPLPWYEGISGSKTLLSLDETGLYVVQRSPDGFDILFVDRPDLPDAAFGVIASMPDEPVRIRVRDNFVYALVRTEPLLGPDTSYDLYRRELVPGAQVAQLARTKEYEADFALDDRFVYMTGPLSDGYEIQVISLKDTANRVRLGTQLEILYPESIDGLLWFFNHHRLRRVDLKLGEL